MKVLKGLALSLLSFLLFLSMTVFGMAFMLKSTVLNPDFVAAELDKVEVSSLVREMVEEQIGEQLPAEAWFLKEALYDVISDHEPWIKEQLKNNIYSGYDYFLGKSERLSFVLSLEPLKESLRDTMLNTFMQSLPPQLSGLPPAQIEQYFEQYYQQFAEQIPSSFEFDESSMPPEAMAQIIQARQYVDYFLLGYNLLIGFMVLLILGIILINRNVRSITRALGIIFTTYGAFEYGGIFLAKYFLPTSLPLPGDVPQVLQTWLLGLIGDFLAPLETFSLGCLIGGVILLVVSFVYRRQPAED